MSVLRLRAGTWDTTALASAGPSHLGLLVLDGALARDVVMADTVSTELVGPGDVVRPWSPQGTATLVPHVIEWTVLDDTRIAILDQRLAIRLGSYPEVAAILFERVATQAGRLAVERAISGLNRVDRRVLGLFWHLAERWGRVTAEGVTVPLTLSHRMIGQLVGARRPTVSTAVGKLRDDGELVRLTDGTWLLTGTPGGLALEALERALPRRRLFSRSTHVNAARAPVRVFPHATAE